MATTPTWTAFDVLTRRVPAIPSWSVFESFPKPRQAVLPDWAGVSEWSALGSSTAERLWRELGDQLERWDDRMAALGGDPSRREWARFRPLRLSREEDWSNWVAFLLAESQSGALAHHLFGPENHAVEPGVWATPAVEREVWTASGERRADIVVTWSFGQRTCVEVKVGDTQFSKTDETADGVGAANSYILLPEEDELSWQAVRSVRTKARTWRDVAIGLRRTLWSRSENLSWAAWAAALTGAIEQTLLGFSQMPLALGPAPRLGQLAATNRLLRFLNEGRRE